MRVGPKPLTTTIGSAPYLDVQTAHDLAFAWGSRSFIKSHNANDVRPEALDEVVELVGGGAGLELFSITALGGAIGRVPEDATAYAGRAAAFDLSADSDWTDARRRREHRLVPPGDGGGRARSDPGRLRERQRAGRGDRAAIFGDAKLARLAALKRAWDPDNVFHVNPNVAPAPPEG